MRTNITADSVLNRLVAIADADPNELCEFRRTCCRFCWGRRNAYQRSAREMERDRAAWVLARDKEVRDGKTDPGPFNEQGGDGYDARKAPNPACEECSGDGIGQAVPKDTRALSAGGRALYAGVKQTKDGVEMKMRDQDAALMALAKHKGLFVERHEVTGPAGGALVVKVLGAGQSMADL